MHSSAFIDRLRAIQLALKALQLLPLLFVLEIGFLLVLDDLVHLFTHDGLRSASLSMHLLQHFLPLPLSLGLHLCNGLLTLFDLRCEGFMLYKDARLLSLFGLKLLFQLVALGHDFRISNDLYLRCFARLLLKFQVLLF